MKLACQLRDNFLKFAQLNPTISNDMKKNLMKMMVAYRVKKRKNQRIETHESCSCGYLNAFKIDESHHVILLDQDKFHTLRSLSSNLAFLNSILNRTFKT